MCIFVDCTGPVNPVDMPKDVQVTGKCSSSNVSCDCSEEKDVQCEQKTESQAYFITTTTREKVAYNRLPFAPTLMNEKLLNPECFHPIALNQLKGFVDVPFHKYDSKDRRYYPEIYYNLYLYHYNLLKNDEIVTAVDLRRKAKQILKWEYPEANTFYHVSPRWLAQYLRSIEKLNKEYHEKHNIPQCRPRESEDEYYCKSCNETSADLSKSAQANVPASEVKASNENPLTQLNVVPEIDLLNLFSPSNGNTSHRVNEYDTTPQTCPQHSDQVKNRTSDSVEDDLFNLFATASTQNNTEFQSTSNSPRQFDQKIHNTRVKTKEQHVPSDSEEDLFNLFATNVTKSNKRSRKETSTSFLPLSKRRRTQNVTYDEDSDSEEDSGNNSEYIPSDEEIKIESEHENTSDYESENEDSNEEFIVDTDVLKKIPRKNTRSWRRMQSRLKEKKRIRQRNRKYFGKRQVNPVMVESVHEELFSFLSSNTEIFL